MKGKSQGLAALCAPLLVAAPALPSTPVEMVCVCSTVDVLGCTITPLGGQDYRIEWDFGADGTIELVTQNEATGCWWFEAPIERSSLRVRIICGARAHAAGAMTEWFESVLVPAIFADGFETGDTSRWSRVANPLIFGDGFESGDVSAWFWFRINQALPPTNGFESRDTPARTTEEPDG